MANRVVVCIPIGFKSRQEIASALVNKYGTDYLFVGRVFQATTINAGCEIDIRNYDVSLASAFEIAGEDKISSITLDQIDHHQQIVYLISTAAGYDACLNIARFTQVFLDIGGIAVKVESAGIAHEKNKWLVHYNSEDVFDIYSLFVTLIEGNDNYYSCGMHNFGKADVSIDIAEDIGLAIYVMNVFNYYRLTESPILQDGHTFLPDIESPTYQIKWTEADEYEADSLLHNPYGKWHLFRISN